MPSIRQTLREMGVSAEQVLSELAQKSKDDTNNGTVPTPLINYLDVRYFCLLYIERIIPKTHFYEGIKQVVGILDVLSGRQLNWLFLS